MVTRGEKGQLQKGSVLNPKGRPKRSREERYLKMLTTSVSDDDWQAIIDRAVSDAKRGDATARKWLTDYLIGPPVERKEISGNAGGPVVLRVIYDEHNQ